MLLLLLLLSIICLFNKWRKLFIQLIRSFRSSRLAHDDDDDAAVVDDEHWRHDDDDGGGNCYIITAYHKLNELRDG